MTGEPDGQYVARAPRFKVTDPSNAVVTITRTEEGDDQALQAHLVDISQHGTKLRVPVNLRFEEALQLNIEVLGTDLEYQGVASVRHIRAIDDESWLVGCAIAPALADETFSYLATAAGKERRRFRRLPIAAEATIRRQTEADGIAASLHNLSSGGFCFSSKVFYETGELVQLAIDDIEGEPRLIEARICWQIESPEGYIAGCQFSSRNSYAEVCACLTEQPSLARNGRHEEPTSKLVLAAAILAMFLPPMMTLLMQTNRVVAEDSTYSQIAENPPAVAVETESSEVVETEPSKAIDMGDTNDGELVIANEAETEPVAASAEEPPATQPLPPATDQQPQPREWVDNTGKFRTQATFAEATDEFVFLRKTDGTVSKVPWRRLSDADHEYVRGWQAREE